MVCINKDTNICMVISLVLVILGFMASVFFMFKHGGGTVFFSWLAVIPPSYSSIVFVVLFCFVSLPFAWGYLALNIGAGYMYGFTMGLAVTMSGALIGSISSTSLCRMIGRAWIERKVEENEKLKAIRQVITGEKVYKIVFLTRLTPVPFGLQNALFSLSPMSTWKYIIATVGGLLPTQIVNTYLGTTLNSISDVIAGKREMDVTTYIMYSVQMIAGLLLMGGAYFYAKKELASVTRRRNSVELEDLVSHP